MSILVVGLSHRSAPIELLERASLDSQAAVKLAERANDAAWVSESAVIATCNRVEVYVEADRFHGAVDEVTELLIEQADLARDELIRHVYVHYDDAAVEHLFTVVAGLDSMIVGEPQILGQVRQSLEWGQHAGTIGTSLNALFQQALRIGKRAHAETGIDRVGASVVDAGLKTAARMGPLIEASETRFLVAGAGSMAALAVSTLIKNGVAADRIIVTNRTHERSAELSRRLATRSARWDQIDSVLADTDVLICATGATGTIFGSDRVADSRRDGRAMTIIDLAMPRDVAPEVAQLPGITVVDLEVLAAQHEQQDLSAEIDQVRSIVAEEVAAFVSVKQASKVTPTVVALRSMATEIVDAELTRARSRLSGLDEGQFDAVEQVVRRVADKLLHGPTVRVQQLADDRPGLTYADALTDLFALDPAAVDAVTKMRGDRP